MKKVILAVAVVLFTSCNKDNKAPTPPSNTCDCYKQYQQMGAGGVWSDTYNTNTFSDLCEKDGDIVEESLMTRYIYVCQ
jgi:hypothetical protein